MLKNGGLCTFFVGRKGIPNRAPLTEIITSYKKCARTHGSACGYVGYVFIYIFLNIYLFKEFEIVKDDHVIRIY